MKVVLLFVAMGFGASIMYSRLFVGVHSIDQVIFGAQIGIWCAFVLQFCLREYIFKEVQELISAKVSDYKPRLIGCLVVYSTLLIGIILEFSIMNALIEKRQDNK